MKLRNTSLFSWTELLPSEMVSKVVKKLTQTPHDEAIKKVIIGRKHLQPSKQKQYSAQGLRSR